MPELTPEELALVEAGESAEDAIEETAEEIDEITEQLVAHSIMSEERHEEIIEKVDECLSRLESSSATAGAENPMLAQLLNQLIEIRAEVTALKSSWDSRNQQQSESIPEVEVLPESVVEDHREAESETPELEAEPGARKKINRKVF